MVVKGRIQQQKDNQYIKMNSTIGERNKKAYYYASFNSDNFARAPKTPIMELKQEGSFDEADIDLIDFVYTVRFCTEEQLIRYGRYKGYEDIENRIALLVGAGVLNSFFETMLNPKDGIIRKPDDAKRYICLKVAGEYLLREFSPRKIIEWEPGDNITHIKNIENQEIFNEFYLDVLTSNKVKITNLWLHPEYSMREKKLPALGHIGMTRTTEQDKEYMVFDAIRIEDNPDDVQEKILRWEDYFINTKSYLRIFGASKRLPTLVFITDNDQAAVRLAGMISRTGLVSSLITTFNRIQYYQLSDMGKFLKYKEEDQQLHEIAFNLFQ